MQEGLRKEGTWLAKRRKTEERDNKGMNDQKNGRSKKKKARNLVGVLAVSGFQGDPVALGSIDAFQDASDCLPS